MNTELFFDCGAPSIYNLLSKKNKNKVMGSHIKQRKRDDFSYVESDEYKAYRKDYAKFLQENHHVFRTYPNLDVINNAELTYKNQKWLEDKGLKPWPVWHFGSDVKWLRRYLKEGYKSLCIGGMVPNSARVLKPALDRLWLKELTDSKGMPLARVHGFAMTSFLLISRYPWFSVDSKSWIDYARFGRILIPFSDKGKLDYLRSYKVAVTFRSLDKRTARRGVHIDAMSAPKRDYVLRYLKSLGIPFGKSSFKTVNDPNYKPIKQKEIWSKPGKEVEVIEQHGVSNTNVMRMDVNLIAFHEIEKSIPSWPWSVHQTIGRKTKGLF